MAHWLAKSEPSAYSWEQLVAEGGTAWTGVRNFQARNHLRAMQPGDRVLFYHSVTGKCVMGVMRVTAPPRPDPTAREGDWTCVDVAPEAAFAVPVPLHRIQADPALAGLALLRQSRLSVMPVTAAQFRRIVALGRG